MNRSGEVAIERASLEHRIGIARSIKFELVDTVLANHLKADFPETIVVLWTGEGEAIVDDLELLMPAELDALLLRTRVATPWRHPHAGSGTVLLRGLPNVSKAVRKAFVETP